MAKPRVFISSTFYDLRQVREDLAAFVRDIGYEPILFEKGNIAYGHSENLEQYCYKEIGISDVLIAVIGGRYGSNSKENDHSITQNEIKHAISEGKQVYLFVEKSVYAEYHTYLLNKDVDGIKYRHVDDVRVYGFLEEIFRLPVNNATFAFESALEITTILREQWAGLFQRLLQDESRRPQTNLLQTLQNTITTLQQALEFLNDKQPLPEPVLLLEHPAFAQLAEYLKIQFRIVFLNTDELNRLLRERGFQKLVTRSDSPVWVWTMKPSPVEWAMIRVAKEVFDSSGKLRMFDSKSWREEWIQLRSSPERFEDTPA